MSERHDNSPHVLTYDLEGYPRQEEHFADRGAAEERANYVRNSGLGTNVSVVLESSGEGSEPAAPEPATESAHVVIEYVPIAQPEPDTDEAGQ